VVYFVDVLVWCVVVGGGVGGGGGGGEGQAASRVGCCFLCIEHT